MQFGAIEIVLPTEAPQALEDAAEAGYDGFEYYVDGPDPGDDPIWTAEGRTRIRRRAHAAGIEIPSVCLGFFNDDPWLTADEPDVRADAIGVLRRTIDVAASLDARVIQVPFFGPAEITAEEHERRVIDGVGAAADDAAAAGVTLAIENTLSADANIELLDAIDSPAVGHYYDVANLTVRGYDPAEEIRTLADRIAMIHIKDTTAMLGEGEVEFEPVAAALAAIDYDDWLVVESFPEDRAAMLEAAATNLAFARGLAS